MLIPDEGWNLELTWKFPTPIICCIKAWTHHHRITSQSHLIVLAQQPFTQPLSSRNLYLRLLVVGHCLPTWTTFPMSKRVSICRYYSSLESSTCVKDQCLILKDQLSEKTDNLRNFPIARLSWSAETTSITPKLLFLHFWRQILAISLPKTHFDEYLRYKYELKMISILANHDTRYFDSLHLWAWWFRMLVDAWDVTPQNEMMSRKSGFSKKVVFPDMFSMHGIQW